MASLHFTTTLTVLEQVLVGRQHHLGIEVDGITYELLIGDEEQAMAEARKRAAAAAAATAATTTPSTSSTASAEALPAAALLPSTDTYPQTSFAISSSPSTSFPSPSITATPGAGGREVAPLQHFSGPRSSRSLELPETTLAGPLELLLPISEHVSIYSPLAADVGGAVRRVVLEPGVTVRVAGLRRVNLRWGSGGLNRRRTYQRQ